MGTGLCLGKSTCFKEQRRGKSIRAGTMVHVEGDQGEAKLKSTVMERGRWKDGGQ